MKKHLVILLVALVAVYAACAAPQPQSDASLNLPSVSEESAAQPTASENESQEAREMPLNRELAIAGMDEILEDDTLFSVRIHVNYPREEQLTAQHLETFVHQDWAVYHYIVPRYAGSSIRVEEMAFDEVRHVFHTTDVLFQSDNTPDGYALLLQADLAETGPQLRVTVTAPNGVFGAYEPFYDGRGDMVYPNVRDGYVLCDTPHEETFVFTNGENGSKRAALKIGDEFIGWKLISAEGDQQQFAGNFEGEATLKGRIEVYPEDDLMGGLVQFFVDSESAEALPYLEGDSRTPWFCMENTDEAFAMIGGKPGIYADCEITIRSYYYIKRPIMCWNSAKLVSVNILGERQEIV